jgi:hypothetical protein
VLGCQQPQADARYAHIDSADAGFGISGRDFTRDELFVIGSLLQQPQAATVVIVLVTAAADSAAITREIEWATEHGRLPH